MQAPRTCVVLQPGYLPWLGFFEQLQRCDEFVFYDDAQYDKHGWRNRNRIKGPAGPQWLTVPVRIHGRNLPRICDVEIDATQVRWAAKHLQALRVHYGPCPGFDWIYPDLERVLRQPWTHIAELDIALVELLAAKLGIERRLHRSSRMQLGPGRSARLIEICRRLGCTRYYSGAAARAYLDVAAFAAAGIAVEFQDYVHPEYPQRYGPFLSHLSVVDLLCNCGPASRRVLAGGAPVAAAEAR